jgi:hypothetical protein
MNHPIYAAMVQAARAKRLPLRFKTDLTRHDKRWIGELAAMGKLEGCGWRLYNSGTHFCRPIEARGKVPPAALMACPESFPGPDDGFFLVRGARLVSVTREHWIDSLTQLEGTQNG